MRQLTYVALIGNAVFILWILYNAIDVGFEDITRLQGIIPLAIALLLGLNLVLLLKLKRFNNTIKG